MKSTNRKKKGQSLLEFLLVAPPLVWLLLGIADFGRAWWTVSVLTDAAREAVRVYAMDPANYGLATGRAASIAAQVAPSPPAVELVDNGDGSVTATQHYNFHFFTPFLPDKLLGSTTTMKNEWLVTP